MATTEKRIMFCATKEDLRELTALCEKFGETQSAVLRRALILLSHLSDKEPRTKVGQN